MKNKALDDAKKYINSDPEYKRDFTYYTLHPEEIPHEEEIEAWQPYTLADAFQERKPCQQKTVRVRCLVECIPMSLNR